MTFRFIPAENSSVDPEYRLLNADGGETRVSIQDCRSYGGGFAVNEYGPEEDFWVETIATTRSLKAAKDKALAHYAKTLN